MLENNNPGYGRLFFPFVFALSLFATKSQGEIKIEETLVVGSYFDKADYGVDTQVSVELDTLRSIAPVDAERLLRRQPGVSVYRPGGAGGVSEVFLRGAEANFTAVIVDGVRMNNSANTRGGSFDFSTLAAGEIGRLDIANGATSAIYGSDAMAGVIRIETLWPKAGESVVQAEGGTENDWRGTVATTFALREALDWSVRASHADGGDEIEGSEYELLSWASRIGGQRANGDKWRMHLRYSERERSSFPEVSGGSELAILRELETAEGEDLAFSAATDLTFSQRWQAELLASWADIEDEIDTPAVAPGVLDAQPAFTTVSDYRRAQLLFINRYRLNNESDLAFGLDYVDERGSDDGAIDFGILIPSAYELDRDISSVFTEWGQRWPGNITSIAVARFDHSEEDSRWSGKLGIKKLYRSDDGRLWLRFANGFKFPSFFALGSPLVGNPELQPEEVESIELGWQQRFFTRFELSVSAFANRYQDLIDFDFESFTNVNRAEVDIDGAEVRAVVDVSNQLQLSADATWLDIDTGEGNGELLRRAERLAGMGVNWQFLPQWNINGGMRYVGSRNISSIPTGEIREGAYTLVDMTLRHERRSGFAFWFAIDNALDEAYQESPGFPAPGARARLGVSYGG